MAERQAYSVLREFHLARKQLGADRMRLHRVEVAVDELIQARSVARDGRGGLGKSRRRERRRETSRDEGCFHCALQ